MHRHSRRVASLFMVLCASCFSGCPEPETPPPPRESAGGNSDTVVGDPAANGSSLSAPAILHLAKQANIAVGELENNELSSAIEKLDRLVEGLPDELLAYRNLAIAHLLAFEEGSGDRAEADQAIAHLEQKEPDSPVPFWLGGRAALKASELSQDPEASSAELRRALAAFDAAAQRDPDNPVFPFAKFEATKRDRTLGEEGREALRAAYDLAPQNVFLLGDWLSAQVTAKDPSIVQTLAEGKRTIAPLARHITHDILNFADLAIQTARGGEWSACRRHVMRGFVLLVRNHDMAQSDKRHLQPHPLEFVLSRFGGDLWRRIPATAHDQPPIEVQFVPPTSFPSTLAGDFLQAHLVDVDLDEQVDLVVLGNDKIAVLGDGGDGEWTPITSADLPAGMTGVLIADLDHDRDRTAVKAPWVAQNLEQPPDTFDADVDFVVFGENGITVLKNELDAESGDRVLVPFAQPDLSVGHVSAGRLVDFDHDSDLDLVLITADGLKLLLSTGTLQFTDVTEFSQLPPSSLQVADLAPVDWDQDVDIDIVCVAGGGQEAGFLENLRHGNFRWVPFSGAFGALSDAEAVAVLDADGNTSWDLACAGPRGISFLATTVRGASPREATRSAVSDSAARRLRVWDFDNDGSLDLLSWDLAGPVRLYRGDSQGGFQLVDGPVTETQQPVRYVDVGDVDGDGDLDLVMVTPAGLACLENDGGNRNNWLQVRALGRVDNKGKANHHGIGSLLQLRSGGRYQARVIDRPITHFGLGREGKADSIRFLWTNGVPQAVLEPESNQTFCEPMELKGSCPYLYAWNGERFSFVTDLLWAAPIGLQVAEGVLAPARPWEYLLVTGDQLCERDGRYEIRITEELWEAAYFDEVALLAVDHPADVEIYSNEKVGPAEIAEFKIHTVQRRHPPVAASDSRGRDVLNIVRKRDGVFWRGFERNLVPGLVNKHFLELDFGDLRGARDIRLFLTGWIYPTDTSLNIAISQDPELDAPVPPSVQVPDEQGVWHEVIPYMGFPGGKTKSIVVDLSDAFLSNDYRLRIVTSAEVYWDEAFIAVDEAPAETVVQRMVVDSATLRYRGFSAASPRRVASPPAYDYERVQSAAKWPPMKGYFTRYGDVTELLRSTDNQLAVLGSGDEMAISFRAPSEPPPPGWRRDFLLYNVGWDKDADLNTVYGQTVEPLPFVDMPSYPYIEPAPQTEAYMKYLKRYQTRQLPPHRFWALRESGEAL